jgi:hypothetical protein
MSAASSVADVLPTEYGGRICSHLRSEAFDGHLSNGWERVNEVTVR